MSKKKGLGRDINTSLEVINDLMQCLNKFQDIKLKQGLKSNKVDDESIVKDINAAMEKASALKNIIEDLKNSISRVKPKSNARFASQRVISKFLSL